ncbi:hypothetical protein VTJ04DRAFT_3358 [Mycothermus thermophilus]|uniref:uncharacterized protein n=1 Tax=Humicola insolens TaxID=85995 RepID=UPI0037443E6C
MSSSRPPARTRTHLQPLFLLLFLFSFFSSFTLAAPHQPWYEKYNQPRVTVPQSYYEASALRRRVGVRAGGVREVKCLDTKARILLHDEHAATLATCPSFSSSSGRSSDNRRCEGDGGVAVGAETVGRVGSAVFELETVERRRRRMALQIQDQTQTTTQGQEQKAVSSSSHSGVSSSPSSPASAGAAGAGEEEATINVTKEAWAACVAAARAVCPMGSFEAVCVGAATRREDVWFQLRRA